MEIKTKMFRSNITKTTAVLVVAVFATALLMGPTLLSIDGVFAKQKYKNWSITVHLPSNYICLFKI